MAYDGWSVQNESKEFQTEEVIFKEKSVTARKNIYIV
jgi:hypothetical protein